MHLFGRIPSLNLPKERFRTGGELQSVFESEETVDLVKELEQVVDLLLDLIGHAD